MILHSVNHNHKYTKSIFITRFCSLPYLSDPTRWRLWRRQTALMCCPAHCQSVPRTEWPSCSLTWKTATSWCRESLTSCSRPPPRSTSSERSQAASPAQTMRWASISVYHTLQTLPRDIYFYSHVKKNKAVHSALCVKSGAGHADVFLCRCCLELLKNLQDLLPHWL